MASKLFKFLAGLKRADEVVHALDEAGIDVNRLIGISNSQGPLARMIHGVIVGAADSLTPAQTARGSEILQGALPPIGSSSKTKKSKGRSKTP